jgi:hypothetical protein
LQPSWRNTLSQTYNVLIATELNGISEDAEKEIDMRLEEHGCEKIPTLSSTWEMKCDAKDESEAKDQAIQIFVNVCRTYPFELRMIVHAGTSQIIRRKKTFEP